nr:cadherin-like domain-containing protein [Bordetella bronchiseptica]
MTATDANGASVSQTFEWDVEQPRPDRRTRHRHDRRGHHLTVTDPAQGVLKNDTDPDNDDLHVSAVNGQPGNVGAAIVGDNGGTFTLNADGTYTFDPGPDFQNLAKDATAETSITYTVSDGEGGTSSATLTVTVTGTNDAPRSPRTSPWTTRPTTTAKPSPRSTSPASSRTSTTATR